jgi:hypothetical protein
MGRTTIRSRRSGHRGARLLPSAVPPNPGPTRPKAGWGTLQLIRARASVREKASSGPRDAVVAFPQGGTVGQAAVHVQNPTVR